MSVFTAAPFMKPDLGLPSRQLVWHDSGDRKIERLQTTTNTAQCRILQEYANGLYGLPLLHRCHIVVLLVSSPECTKQADVARITDNKISMQALNSNQTLGQTCTNSSKKLIRLGRSAYWQNVGCRVSCLFATVEV